MWLDNQNSQQCSFYGSVKPINKVFFTYTYTNDLTSHYIYKLAKKIWLLTSVCLN